MCEEKLPESVYKETLNGLTEALKILKELMKSEDENTRLRAVENYLAVSELVIALAEALGEQKEWERNPLSRRFREEGGGVL